MKEVNYDRFYVERSQFDKYGEIEADDSFFMKSHHEVFLLSACIGVKYNLRKKIIDRYQLTGKNGIFNLKYGQNIYNLFSLLAKESGEVDDENKVMVNTLLEEYANGGFDKLYNEILDKQKPISNSDKFLSYIILSCL